MYLNESDVRSTEERRKDLRRQAERERLVKQSRLTQKRTRRSAPLWLRVWTLF